LKCPFCGIDDDKVIDSRPAEDGNTVRRRRECLHCGRRWSTREAEEMAPLIVIKKDKSRQPFDRRKLIAGIMKSCEKRPVSLEAIEQIVDHIERSEIHQISREISTAEIGEAVLKHLRSIDEVAYIRFMSVYREFSDVASFLNELESLKHGEGI
jgi:transcriptional repressor NrdR